MKLMVTKITHITSKKNGKNYVILNGIQQDGTTKDVLLSEERFKQSMLSDANCVDKETMQSFYAENPKIDIEYNDKGFVENIEVE